MVLVTAAAYFMAVLFLLFKVFELRRIPLLPAIVVNYYVACICGILVAPPWQAGDLTPLALPSAVLGFLFITIFYLTGLSAQRAGVAATTVASKMSLVLTVLFAVYLYGDRPGVIGWTGIALALVGVALASWVRTSATSKGEWLLPATLFIGNAIIDITINWVQRMHLTQATEAVFPTLLFAVAGTLGTAWSLLKRERGAFSSPGVWIGGTVLGIMNYAALYFVVQALTYSALPSSSVYPLVNIVVILFGTAASIALFKERPRTVQYVGIACAVIALVLLLNVQP
jgi:drug/metabolite transporter (DMT)-like permease